MSPFLVLLDSFLRSKTIFTVGYFITLRFWYHTMVSQWYHKSVIQRYKSVSVGINGKYGETFIYRQSPYFLDLASDSVGINTYKSYHCDSARYGLMLNLGITRVSQSAHDAHDPIYSPYAVLWDVLRFVFGVCSYQLDGVWSITFHYALYRIQSVHCLYGIHITIYDN